MLLVEGFLNVLPLYLLVYWWDKMGYKPFIVIVSCSSFFFSKLGFKGHVGQQEPSNRHTQSGQLFQ